MATRVQKIMTQPINLIFRFLQQKARVCVWLFENTDLRIEGQIIGFDEFMTDRERTSLATQVCHAYANALRRRAHEGFTTMRLA